MGQERQAQQQDTYLHLEESSMTDTARDLKELVLEILKLQELEDQLNDRLHS